MSLGEFVKEHREKRGLKVKELATLVGVHFTYIYAIERGRHKPLPHNLMENLSKALQVKLGELYKVAGITLDNKASYQTAPKSIQDLTIREISNNFIEVPVIADMHAPGHVQEYIYLPRVGTSHTKLYGVKIIGNCLSPEVHEGDIIIIDKEDLDYHGKKILCYHDGNEHPQIIKCKNPADLEKCEVYGVILWIMKKP